MRELMNKADELWNTRVEPEEQSGFANPKQFVWPYIHANPTHWMPLQAPPAALAEGAQG